MHYFFFLQALFASENEGVLIDIAFFYSFQFRYSFNIKQPLAGGKKKKKKNPQIKHLKTCGGVNKPKKKNEYDEKKAMGMKEGGKKKIFNFKIYFYKNLRKDIFNFLSKYLVFAVIFIYYRILKIVTDIEHNK